MIELLQLPLFANGVANEDRKRVQAYRGYL
jgi:hypothetical protein